MLSLLPGFFFLEHVSVDGFPTALGLSGSGPGTPVAPPRGVRVMRDGSAPFVTVATDGFFLLETYGYSLSVLLPSTTVSVTTLDGQAVPGKLEVFTGTSQPFLAWSADAPLSDGATLRAVVTGGVAGAPVFPDQVELHVSGAPAELAGTALAFGDWVDFRHGVGDPVMCTSTPVSTLTIPSAEEQLVAAHTSYRAPQDVKSYVLWEVRVAPDVRVTEPLPQFALVIHPSTLSLPLGLLVFPKDSAKHCATLVVKDLRTGESRESRECTTPGSTTELVRDFALEACSAPPSAALTRAWCELHPESTLQACTGKAPPQTEPIPTDPQEPMPTDPMPRDPMTQEPLPTSQEADNAARAEPRTIRSCQLGVGGVDAGNVSLLLAALGFSAFRRRRARS